MTDSAQLSSSAGRLRAAMASGAYPQARLLLDEYCRAAEAVLRALPAGSAEQACLARDSAALLRWVREMAQSGRAHAAERLARLPARSPYQRRGPGRLHTWEFEG